MILSRLYAHCAKSTKERTLSRQFISVDCPFTGYSQTEYWNLKASSCLTLTLREIFYENIFKFA